MIYKNNTPDAGCITYKEQPNQKLDFPV